MAIKETRFRRGTSAKIASERTASDESETGSYMDDGGGRGQPGGRAAELVPRDPTRRRWFGRQVHNRSGGRWRRRGRGPRRYGVLAQSLGAAAPVAPVRL